MLGINVYKRGYNLEDMIDFILVNLLREGVNIEDANVPPEAEVANKGCV